MRVYRVCVAGKAVIGEQHYGRTMRAEKAPKSVSSVKVRYLPAAKIPQAENVILNIIEVIYI